MGEFLIEALMWPFIDAGKESPRWMRVIGAALWIVMGALLVMMTIALSGALG